MKNYQKVALGTVSVLAAFTLVACGSSAKSKSSSGKTTLHMYQIGDKPDNYKELMAKTKRKGKTQEIAKSAMTILKTKLTGRLNPRTDNEAIFFFFIYY